MPELPEIESLRRQLALHLTGAPLEVLDVLDGKAWRPQDGVSAGDVVGRAVCRVDRRAKLLLLGLEGGYTLVAHLKMSGQVVYLPAAAGQPPVVGGYPYEVAGGAMPAPITRVALRFAARGALYLNDRRRFAWLRLLKTDDLKQFLDARRYGPDPLDPDFAPALLGRRLTARRGRAIKAALLDQTCLAGLGSIYADEALHRAGLHPATRTGALTQSEVAALHRGILDAVMAAIAVGGAVVIDSRALPARPGEAGGVDLLRVHGRAGLPCPTCSPAGPPARGRQVSGGCDPGERIRAPRIEKTTVGGRTSYYCPVCQGAADDPPASAPRRRAPSTSEGL